MRLPTLLQLLLKPVVRPIRAAIERIVTALIDARLSGYQNRPEPPGSGDSPQNLLSHLMNAPLLAPFDKYSHPNPGRLWVILRDQDNAKLTIKFFGYELGTRFGIVVRKGKKPAPPAC